MFEKTRGEVLLAARRAIHDAKSPADIVSWLETDTLPFFKGNFEAAVEAIAGADNGPNYQGAQPDIWSRITSMDVKKAPYLASALTAIAINKGIEPPPSAQPV
jgi:hypothetical protein